MGSLTQTLLFFDDVDFHLILTVVSLDAQYREGSLSVTLTFVWLYNKSPLDLLLNVDDL